MIGHIFRMVWNRKKSNLLIWLEILASFLVVYAVAAFAVFFLQNARKPMGFDITNVWQLYVGAPSAGSNTEGDSNAEERRRVEDLILQEAKAFENVQAAAVVHYPPYMDWSSIWGWNRDQGKHSSEIITVSDTYPEVLGLELLAGRFFEVADHQRIHRPVVINQRLAQEIFGDEDPIGQTIDEPDPDEPDAKLAQVIGVFDDYRKSGEFSNPENVLLMHFRPDDPDRDRLLFLTLKMQPGTSPQYEETILRRLRALAPGWSFRVTPLEEARDAYREENLQALLLAGLIAGFLLLMVALGLIGVLWQAVTQRMLEMGIRRAKGAAARQIYTQVLGELLGVTVLAVLVGTAILLQLPWTGWFEFLTAEVTVPAYGVAVLAVLLLTTICGLYPSRLASRITPAEALHYE